MNWVPKKSMKLKPSDPDFLVYHLIYRGFLLQMGMAHCGEHSHVAYLSLRDVMLADNGKHASLLGSIVLSGQANEDHAFVLGGIRPTKVIRTTARSSTNGQAKVGETIDVWNLRDARMASGAEGFVGDPYLDPSQIGDTARELLAQLNRSGRSNRTEWVWFNDDIPPGIHPGPSPTIEERDRVPGI